MSDDKESDGSVVEVARKRFQRANDFYQDNRQKALADTRFVMGDSDNNWQWPDDIYRTRSNVNRKPCLTINTTAQHCNQIINNIRQNRPSVRILPVDGGADQKTAEIMGGLIRSIQAQSSADTAHDLAAEHSIYGGEGYWRIRTDYVSYDSFDQQILIEPIVNPRLVLIDPDSVLPDRSDACWGFIFNDLSKALFQERYPNLEFASWVQNSDKGWYTQDTVREAEYFWCEYKDDVLYLLTDGQILLKSQLKGVELPPEAIHTERKTQRSQWYWCKLVGDSEDPVEKTEWPGSYLPIITLVGKELNVDGQIVRKGLVRDLKDTARMVNYSFSAAVETVALQTKIPYIAAAEALEGYESIWSGANQDNRAYLPFNAFDEEGRPLPPPVRQPPAVMPSAQVQMLQVATEEMRAASGQQNANFGIKSEAQSGVGIQRLKAQGEIATFHFPDNLIRALHYEARVLLDLIPKVYKKQQVVRILGLDGKEKGVRLDPQMAQAHAKIVNDQVDESFNPNVGRYDVAIDTGPSFQTQRQEAAAALTELSTKNPQLMAVAGDLVVRSFDFPGSDQIAKRIEKSLPPNLRDDEGGVNAEQENMQLKQHAQQANQIIEAMQQHIEQLEQTQAADVLKNQTQLQIEEGKRVVESERLRDESEFNEMKQVLEEYRAETERLKTLEPFMTPEALKPVVMQMLQEILTTQIPPPEAEIVQEQPPEGGFFTPGESEASEEIRPE